MVPELRNIQLHDEKQVPGLSVLLRGLLAWFSHLYNGITAC